MDQNNVLSMKLSKTNKEITVTVDYFVPETNRNRTEEINEIPHQDFNAALLSLSPYLSKVFHSDSEDYAATGFKYTTNNKVIITGKLVTESGSIVGISTPAIDTDDEVYGFEKEFAEDLSTLVMETLQLLTGKKVGVKQLTIDDQPADDTKFDYTDGEEQKMDDDEIEDKKVSKKNKEEDPLQYGLNEEGPDNKEFVLPE